MGDAGPPALADDPVGLSTSDMGRSGVLRGFSARPPDIFVACAADDDDRCWCWCACPRGERGEVANIGLGVGRDPP